MMMRRLRVFGAAAASGLEQLGARDAGAVRAVEDDGEVLDVGELGEEPGSESRDPRARRGGTAKRGSSKACLPALASTLAILPVE